MSRNGCPEWAGIPTLTALADFYVGAAVGNTWQSATVDADEVLDQVSEISENSTGWKAFGGFKCVFRRFRTPIPADSGHLIRLIPDAWSGSFRTRSLEVSAGDYF
jgi:hypothetical protein